MSAVTVRTSLIAPALAVVAASGGDAAALQRAFNLPSDATTRAATVMPVMALQAFMDAAASMAKAPSLGIDLAEQSPRGSYGLAEFVSLSAPTVRGACRRLARYIELATETVQAVFREDDQGATIEQRLPDGHRGMGRHGNEYHACLFMLHLRRATGVDVVPANATFDHAPPLEVARLMAALGTRNVAFGCKATGIRLSNAVLDLPLRSADDALSQLLEEQAELALAARVPARGFVERVRRAVREGLKREAPTLESHARALRMSPRTLQRKLCDENYTFQQLVDSVRTELARSHLSDGKLSLTEIAFALGYTSPNAFMRACKRWTGSTPTQLRRVRSGVVQTKGVLGNLRPGG